MTKTATYFPYARKPLEVVILRSTATRHLVVSKQIWETRDEWYTRLLSSYETTIESEEDTFLRDLYIRWTNNMLSYGNASVWVEKQHGKWVSHKRVANISE